jgi:hypothetical protein
LGGNFAFDGTDVSGARLVIEFGVLVPVPSIHPIALYTLVPGLLVGVALVAMHRRGGRE